MTIFNKCTFYKESQSISVGTGLGVCSLSGRVICEGDIQFCENLEELRKQLEKENEKLENGREERDNQGPPKYKVLVVDDEEPVAKIVVAFLSRQGHECVTASNGVEALGKIHQNKFDAVITDIVMPQMDGITLTKELLGLYPNLPIMVVTGYSRDYPAESAIAAGARDFIGKPFRYDELILRFNKMMSDHEILMKVEAKQKEMLFHIQGESSEKIYALQREVESLKSRLRSGYPRFNR
jgi:CheY-like chemotaxis protein